MPWRLTGQILESCSCKMLCPCIFGPADPDQGWCAVAICFDIRQGQADGVNLSDRRVVCVVSLPGDFSSGNGTARLYLDEGASADQRRELEAIFQGKNGGPWGVVSGLITEWLPTQNANIEIQSGGHPSFTVGNVGQVKLEPIKTQEGRPTMVVDAPVWVALGFKNENLARSDGSHWFDPGMRPWVSGGYGAIFTFTWSAWHNAPERACRTNRCSRLPTASAALPLPGAAELLRWASVARQ
jgi:hypothetical protein